MPPIIDLAFEQDAFNLIMAVLLGGGIGIERQWRQRLAGLRTNTLVSLEYIVGCASLEPSVTAARWRTVTTFV